MSYGAPPGLGEQEPYRTTPLAPKSQPVSVELTHHLVATLQPPEQPLDEQAYARVEDIAAPAPAIARHTTHTRQQVILVSIVQPPAKRKETNAHSSVIRHFERSEQSSVAALGLCTAIRVTACGQANGSGASRLLREP
jgi:hypothetical protein